jgi:hypothetical protein
VVRSDVSVRGRFNLRLGFRLFDGRTHVGPHFR